MTEMMGICELSQLSFVVGDTTDICLHGTRDDTEGSSTTEICAIATVPRRFHDTTGGLCGDCDAWIRDPPLLVGTFELDPEVLVERGWDDAAITTNADGVFLDVSIDGSAHRFHWFRERVGADDVASF